MPRPARVLSLIALCSLLLGCAEPPQKEMHQAQGAIDAARAAGADRYAATELGEAVTALQASETAVTQKDYRLALSHAIDSRERAQNAAKVAGETRARARGDAERVVAEASVRLTQARARLDQPALAKLPRRTLTDLGRTLDGADTIMQEARAALEAEDYPRSIEHAERVSALVKETIGRLEEAQATAAAPRRRR